MTESDKQSGNSTVFEIKLVYLITQEKEIVFMDDYVFMTRPYWLELSVPQSVVRRKYTEYFGDAHLELSTRKSAVEYLLSITGKIQTKMTEYLKNENTCCLLKDLYKILDETFHFYLRQKEARKKLCELNIQEKGILDVFEENPFRPPYSFGHEISRQGKLKLVIDPRGGGEKCPEERLT